MMYVKCICALSAFKWAQWCVYIGDHQQHVKPACSSHIYQFQIVTQQCQVKYKAAVSLFVKSMLCPSSQVVQQRLQELPGKALLSKHLKGRFEGVPGAPNCPFCALQGSQGPKLFPSKPNNPHHTLVLRVSLKYSVVLVGVLLGHYIAVWCACILGTRMNECPFFKHCPNSHWTPLHLRSCSLAGIFSNLILLSLL